MKTIFAVVGVIATLLVGSAGVMAFAGHRNHDSGHGGHRVGFMIERLGDKLDLSAEQESQLKVLASDATPLMKRGRQMMKNLRREMMDFSTMGADYETRMIRLADEQADLTRQMVLQAADLKLKVSQILSQDQLAKLQELGATSKGRWRGKRHGWRFGDHGVDDDNSVENGTSDQ